MPGENQPYAHQNAYHRRRANACDAASMDNNVANSTHATSSSFRTGQIVCTRESAMRRLVTAAITTGALVVPIAVLDAHPGQVDRNGCHHGKSAAQRHCHPERAAFEQSATRTGTPKPGDEGVFDGPLAWVSDGDTLRVRVRGQEMDVRLADVDAPERDQPYGWRAKLELIDLVRDAHIVLVPRDVDQYGRVVADAWVGEVEISRELVKRGAVWFYAEYAQSDDLYREEQRARSAKIGLWALPSQQRVEPWEWRRRVRESSGRAQRKRSTSGE